MEHAQALWDDLFLLVPAYMVSVGIARRFGPLKQDENQCGVDWTKKTKIWTPIMIVYNILMTIFSFVCFTAMTYVVVVKKNMQIQGPDCNDFFGDWIFRNCVWAFYVSKYVEFADTLFLMVKGKPVSWLHFFHHCGAAINMGLLYKSKMEATYIFVTFNGFVHTVMYAYYCCALLGIRLRGKSSITTMQILQFVFGLSFFYTYSNVPCFKQSDELMFVFNFTYFYVGSVLLFFLNFYIQNYMRSAKTVKKAKDL